MSETRAVPIRWPLEVLDLIDRARGDESFSDFVRTAARDRAIARLKGLEPTPEPAPTLLDDVAGDDIPLSDPRAMHLAGADSASIAGPHVEPDPYEKFVGADPGIEVGGTSHKPPSQASGQVTLPILRPHLRRKKRKRQPASACVFASRLLRTMP